MTAPTYESGTWEVWTHDETHAPLALVVSIGEAGGMLEWEDALNDYEIFMARLIEGILGVTYEAFPHRQIADYEFGEGFFTVIFADSGQEDA